MGEAIDTVLDVTLHYMPARPTLVDLFCNRVREVRVHVQARPVPAGLAEGDYEADRAHRVRFQGWINEMWLAKDARLAAWNAADEIRGD